MLSRLSVRTKLLTMLLIPLILFAGTSVFLLMQNGSNVKKLTGVLHDQAYDTAALIYGAERDMYRALAAYGSVRLASSDKDRSDADQDFRSNVANANYFIQQTMKIIQEYRLEDRLKAEDGTPFVDILKQVEEHFNDWSYAAKENIDNGEYPYDKSVSMLEDFSKAREGMNNFNFVIDDYMDRSIEDINQDVTRTSIFTYAVLAITWLLIIISGYLMIRQISRIVQEVLKRTQLVSQGNLQTEARSEYPQDELGKIWKSVDMMTANMRTLIGQIMDHTRTVSAASVELSSGARESAASADHVAQNIQEVNALVDVQSQVASDTGLAIADMAVGVQKIAESTGVISEYSAETNRQAEQGSDRLLMLKAQMKQMTDSIENLSRSITVLNEKSEQIGSISERITGFANQTGILSLNASIEAARAGEHGRGFAVVAAEIRKLASASLESSRVINDLISDTRSEIGQTSSYMRTTMKQAEQGSVIMEEVSRGFHSIVQSIQQVASQIHDTLSVTEQMSASSEEVSASMEQTSSSARLIAGKAQNVAAATEEQLALVESIARASERLEEIVGQLNRSVESFKL